MRPPRTVLKLSASPTRKALKRASCADGATMVGKPGDGKAVGSIKEDWVVLMPKETSDPDGL